MAKPIIVAEIGASHAGKYENAVALIKAARESGADFVKLQTFHPDRMVLDTSYVIKSGPWRGKNLHKLYAETMTPWDWHHGLFDYANSIGLGIFSSPFSPEDVALLETIHCPRYKIASFDVGDVDLIEACAMTGNPIIISTGMATDTDISIAIETAKKYGSRDITILACVSDYPADVSQYDLAKVTEIASAYSVKWGISDHTTNSRLAIAATVMGATMIERHISLGYGHDATFASQPQDFARMVSDVLGACSLRFRKNPYSLSENQGHEELRKSLYFTVDLDAGEMIQPYHVRACRPAEGIPANQSKHVIGRKLIRPAKAKTPVTWDHLIEA